MTELERFLKLPIDICPNYQQQLRYIYFKMVQKGRNASTTQDILEAVKVAYVEWRKEVWGLVNRRTTSHPLISAFTRTLLIAIPDVFVVAYRMEVFGAYEMDADEKAVHDIAKTEFESKLKLAKMFDAMPLELRILNTLKSAHPPPSEEEERIRWARPSFYGSDFDY